MSQAHSVLVRIAAIDAMTAPLRQMEKGVIGFAQRAENSISRVESRFLGLKNKLNDKTFGIGGALLGFGAFQIGASAFQDVKEFNTKLVAVKKTAGLTDEAMDKLGTSFIQTSKKLGSVSSSRLAELGVVAGQNLPKINGSANTSDILKFSEIFGMFEQAAPSLQGEEGAMDVMSVLNITGESTKQLSNFTSALVHAGNTFNVTEASLIPMMLEVARGSSKFHTTAKEVAGLSVALQSARVGAEGAGSVIMDVMNKMDKASDFGGKKLSVFAKYMGLSEQEASKMIKANHMDAFMKLTSNMGRLTDQGGNLNRMFAELGFTNKRVDKTMSALISNHAKVTENVNQTTKAYEENKALFREFIEGQKSLGSATDSLSIAWSNHWLEVMQTNGRYNTLRDTIKFVALNLDTILSVLGYLTMTWITAKLAVMAYNIVLTASSIALGVYTFATKASAMALRGNTIALGVYRTALILTNAWTWISTTGIKLNTYTKILASSATWLFTAATSALGIALGVSETSMWGLNIAMYANPIGGMILLVMALIVAMGTIIYYWDSWGHKIVAVAMYLGGPLLAFIGSLIRNWDLLTNAFSNGSILDSLKAIGFVIFDTILTPFTYLLEVLDKITGTDFAKSLNKLKEDMKSDITLNSETSTLNSKAEKQLHKSESKGKGNNDKLVVDFQNMPQGVGVSNSSGIGVSTKDHYGMVSR